MSMIIQEGAIFSENKIINEYNNGKVIIETYLQEADTPNKNKRIYPKDVISDSMKRKHQDQSNRNFLGELDHPISDNQVRQTTVLYKECSHIVKEYGWDGNLLKAVVETLPYTKNGKTMSGLIRDRIPVGFSLRALADLIDNGIHKVVKKPMITICYDCVSNPSNPRAVIQEIKMEQTSILLESANTICLENGQCYLKNYFDMLVEAKIIKLRKMWI